MYAIIIETIRFLLFLLGFRNFDKIAILYILAILGKISKLFLGVATALLAALRYVVEVLEPVFKWFAVATKWIDLVVEKGVADIVAAEVEGIVKVMLEWWVVVKRWMDVVVVEEWLDGALEKGYGNYTTEAMEFMKKLGEFAR